jgi:signal transduction histidine kinase
VRRDLRSLLALTPIGLVQVAVGLLAPAAIALVAMPAYFWLPSRLLGPGVFPVVEGQVIDTLPKAVIVSVAGLILVVVVPRLVLATASMHVAVARRLLAKDRDDALAERVETLTSNRARAMDAVAAERQRIERDLHDGAQQRLVALALDLGRARSKIETDPAAAAGLVAEAHEEAKQALAEIRDLARGIYPAVLTDRGLDASISALAARCPVPVDAYVRLSGRLSAPIESTAYFIIAEALTNAARHGSASRVRVDLRLEGSTLIVEVTDDGRGGADPGRGSGLRGLADRLAAFDGTLRVDSPAGGPTRVRAELPCGS